jgi:hypothetical protein
MGGGLWSGWLQPGPYLLTRALLKILPSTYCRNCDEEDFSGMKSERKTPQREKCSSDRGGYQMIILEADINDRLAQEYLPISGNKRKKKKVYDRGVHWFPARHRLERIYLDTYPLFPFFACSVFVKALDGCVTHREI